MVEAAIFSGRSAYLISFIDYVQALLSLLDAVSQSVSADFVHSGKEQFMFISHICL